MSSDVVMILKQIHTDSWFWILLLFILSYLLSKAGKMKAQKIVRMIFRLIALVMIITGALMLSAYQFPLAYIIKGISAFLMIGVMEMILSKTVRRESAGALWIGLIVLLAFVLLIAFRVITF